MGGGGGGGESNCDASNNYSVFVVTKVPRTSTHLAIGFWHVRQIVAALRFAPSSPSRSRRR